MIFPLAKHPTKVFLHIFSPQVPFQLHVIVGPVDSDAVAKLVAKKSKDLEAEMTVVARHSKGRFKEYWVGSVTKALIKLSPVPLAVVPPK